MRIVIDLQGAQTDSRFRGIGRYSLGLALGIARNAGEHEIWLVLNAALPQSIPQLRRAFEGLIPQERIRVFDIPAPVAEHDQANGWRTRASEKIREYFIAQLRPDAVLVTSLFEGYVDDGVESVGMFSSGAHTAVILYDLIPLLNPDQYLGTPLQRDFYYRKIASLRNAGLLLAISDYSRHEAIEALDLKADCVVSISTAVDDRFQPDTHAPGELEEVLRRFGIGRKMVMYAPGGFDARKNIDGLMAAYALLPADIRTEHQLVIASKLGDAERFRLTQMQKQAGLAPDELVLTGYVPDADLGALYSAATLFVFPSKHEGFGLPALEAMACGAPVIGSNRTSIPEVIGLEDALFDPLSPPSIARKMEEVLRDEQVRNHLREHGIQHARKFSWDTSAIRALRALEVHVQNHSPRLDFAPDCNGERLRLAFISPLPPERTGIADYSAELLLELSRHYNIELVINQATVTLPTELQALPQRSAEWFGQNAAVFDRIVYQFGNSPFHTHMFGLLREHPGVVVLHDFFFSGVLAYEEMRGTLPNAWTDALYQSHGYLALQARFDPARMEQAKDTYPCNLEVLQNARGVIVHSEYPRKLARQWYGADAAVDWKHIPLLRTRASEIARTSARNALGIATDAFVVCSFGFVDATKFSHRLVEAWLSSCLARDGNCHLILVGENHGGDYGAQLSKRISNSGCDGRIRITGWADTEVYRQYLQAADAGVQLRSLSRGETSAAVLDCMNYALPTIVNANGSMADLPEDAVWKLPETFADTDLVTALQSLWENPARRGVLGLAAQEFIHTQHSPSKCARQYVEAIEASYADACTDMHSLVQALAEIPQANEEELQRLSQSVALSTSMHPAQRQLLVDVSAIARNDLQTGIERVVRAQLYELLQNPPAGFKVEPVYLSAEGGAWHYRYAHSYTKKLLSIGGEEMCESPVDVCANDVFYSPDFSPGDTIAAAASGLYADWRARGVEINFLIHDILPLLKPQFFPTHADEQHARWLDCIAGNADRLVCISHAVADEVIRYLQQRGIIDMSRLKTAVVHHGADIGASVPSSGIPDSANSILERLGSAPSFLMVGTIEPRKGHLQAIAAFERLWSEGVDANLVIVGKEGWKPLPQEERRTIPEIVGKLGKHPELGKHILWLQGISDEYLQRIYGTCSCLIFASEGEGFGLPLIEAAQHNLPVIARDLPVFREVAASHALYFNGLAAADLAATVREWLRLDAEGNAPTSAGIQWRTWAENARELCDILTSKAGHTHPFG